MNGGGSNFLRWSGTRVRGWTNFSRTFLGAYSLRGGQARNGRPDRDGDFETRVMAFLVLSCVRTLTLLVHIRAWSWLPPAFLPRRLHLYAYATARHSLYGHARRTDGIGARLTRVSSRDNDSGIECMYLRIIFYSLLPTYLIEEVARMYLDVNN